MRKNLKILVIPVGSSAQRPYRKVFGAYFGAEKRLRVQHMDVEPRSSHTENFLPILWGREADSGPEIESRAMVFCLTDLARVPVTFLGGGHQK